jgi:hypothetical protein
LRRNPHVHLGDAESRVHRRAIALYFKGFSSSRAADSIDFHLGFGFPRKLAAFDGPHRPSRECAGSMNSTI